MFIKTASTQNLTRLRQLTISSYLHCISSFCFSLAVAIPFLYLRLSDGEILTVLPSSETLMKGVLMSVSMYKGHKTHSLLYSNFIELTLFTIPHQLSRHDYRCRYARKCVFVRSFHQDWLGCRIHNTPDKTCLVSP